MELAVHREVMTWNENTYHFVPNTVFGSKFIPSNAVIQILKDLSNAMLYLHNQIGVVHRDIKPQNILLCSNP
jgi:serine/threonine protein kinase